MLEGAKAQFSSTSHSARLHADLDGYPPHVTGYMNTKAAQAMGLPVKILDGNVKDEFEVVEGRIRHRCKLSSVACDCGEPAKTNLPCVGLIASAR